jgi:DNA-binding MarR family transcriptional regulator
MSNNNELILDGNSAWKASIIHNNGEGDTVTELKKDNRNYAIGAFTQNPIAVLFLYNRLPDFGANEYMVYAALIHYENKDKGYAYPSQYQLRIDLGISRNAVNTALKNLEKYGLILKGRDGRRFIYKLLEPIKSEEELYTLVQDGHQAQKLYAERVKVVTAEKNKHKKRKEDYENQIELDRYELRRDEYDESDIEIEWL